MKTRCLILFALLLPSLAAAKDELIPTDRTSRDREDKKQNPLYDVAGDMDAVARLLRVEKTDDTTQDRQKSIIEKLDKLIEMAKQQSQQPPKSDKDEEQKKQQQQQQPQPKPSEQQQQQEKEKEKQAAKQQEQQQNRPGIGRGASGEGNGQIRTDAEEWGNLPPAIRDQLLNIQGEGFPLKYRELLRRYYRDLAKPRD